MHANLCHLKWSVQGRGRGNSFLNDLCEASVLLHVVDVSGTTDKEGRAVVGCAPEGMHSLSSVHAHDKYMSMHLSSTYHCDRLNYF